MAIATFGSKTFEVSAKRIHTFTDFEFKAGLNLDIQENDGAKPSTYNKGPNLKEFSMVIFLHAELGVKPLGEVESWVSIVENATQEQFILNGKPFGNCKYICKEASMGDAKIDNFGNVLACELKLTFQEYAKKGKKQSTSSTKKSTASKNTASVYNALSPSQKAEVVQKWGNH